MTKGVQGMGDDFDDFCAMSGRTQPCKAESELSRISPPLRDDCPFTPEVKYVPAASPRTSPRGSTNSTSSNTSGSHHTRSASCKKVRSRARNLELEEMRPRTASMPTKNHFQKPNKNYLSPPFPYDNADDDDDEEYNRVRTFTTSSKGIKNRGDSFKRKSKSSSSVASNGSASGENGGTPPPATDDEAATESRDRILSVGSSCCSSAASEPLHRVMILGQSAVGKTALIQQFTTSEYLGASVECTFDDEFTEKSVSVLLDDTESTMFFTEAEDESTLRDVAPDAYVVVYSVTDRSSFEYVTDLLFKLRKEEHRSTAVIMVANKSDLVRLRQISMEEGKVVATTYDCKFIETSAVLNHQVDELLVGVLSQIRLHEKEYKKKVRKMKEHNNNNVVQKAAKGLLTKIFKNSSSQSRSCDNLLKL